MIHFYNKNYISVVVNIDIGGVVKKIWKPKFVFEVVKQAHLAKTHGKSDKCPINAPQIFSYG